MFNLIVAVISIALIAAMAAASIFYGGTAFGEGTAKAQASTLINNGQQISGAQQLYMIDNSGNRANAIAVLTTGGYLQAEPTAPANVIAAGAEWDIDDAGRIAFIALDDSNANQQNSPAWTVCSEVIAQGGADPEDHTTNSANNPGAISESYTAGAGIVGKAGDYANLLTDLADLGDDQFMCATTSATGLNDAAGTTLFVYKL